MRVGGDEEGGEVLEEEEKRHVECHSKECGEEGRAAESVEVRVGSGEVVGGLFVIVDEGGVGEEESILMQRTIT